MNNKSNIKKSIIIITIGIINTLHAGLHIVHFMQSLILFGHSISHGDSQFIDFITHSPIFTFLWAIVGLVTLWMGIKDFIHHRECDKKIIYKIWKDMVIEKYGNI